MLHNSINKIIPTVGLGCCNLTRENNAIVDYAIKNAVIFFDTADCYGANESEIALGEKLKNYARDKLFVSTKAGIRFQADGVVVNGSKEYIKAACYDSLKRLQTDYIDLFYLHRVDPCTSLQESVQAMKELVEEGKVRYIGLSEVTAEQIRIAQHIHPISAVQIEYSPWARQDEINGVIDTCKELNIAIVAYSPLGRAFFTSAERTYFDTLPADDLRQLLPRYKGENLQFNLAQRQIIQQVANEKHCSLAQLVLAWEMTKGFIIIPGTTNPVHFDENKAACNIILTEEDCKKIDELVGYASYQGPRYPNEKVSAIYTDANTMPKVKEVRKLSVLSSTQKNEKSIIQRGFFADYGINQHNDTPISVLKKSM